MKEYTLGIITVPRGDIKYHLVSVEGAQGKIAVSLQDMRLADPYMFLRTIARLVKEYEHYYADK